MDVDPLERFENGDTGGEMSLALGDKIPSFVSTTELALDESELLGDGGKALKLIVKLSPTAAGAMVSHLGSTLNSLKTPSFSRES